VRETDGACQTVVCGFIQIYDGRRRRGADVNWGRESGRKGGDGGTRASASSRARF